MRVLSWRLGTRPSKTRIPFRYGKACLVDCPQALLEIKFEIDGRAAVGYASDCLPPSWFDKSGSRTFAEQIEDIRFSIEGATKETYEIMRFPAKYEKLIENLEIFTKVNKNNKYFKDVRLSSVICKTTLPELALHFEVYGKYIPVSNMGFALINSLAPTNNFFDNDKILTKHLILNNPCGAIFGKSHHILANG